MANRYDQPARPIYSGLRDLLSDREQFMVTTNVDQSFPLNGFDGMQLFAMQGDYSRFRCSVPCHQESWSNESQVRAMVAEQREGKVPSPALTISPKEHHGIAYVGSCISKERRGTGTGLTAWRYQFGKEWDLQQTISPGDNFHSGAIFPENPTYLLKSSDRNFYTPPTVTRAV